MVQQTQGEKQQTQPMEELIEESYKVVINADLGPQAENLPWYTNRIVGYLPQEGYDFTFSSSWDSPLELGGDSVNTGAQLLGVSSFKTRKLSQQIWQGADPIKGSIELEFFTWEDPVKDVMKPSLTMAIFPLPSVNDDGGEESWLLDPPVDLLNRGGRSISINMAGVEIPELLPVDASPSFHGQKCTSPSVPGKTFPARSTVTFEFIMSQAPTRKLKHLGFDIEGLT